MLKQIIILILIISTVFSLNYISESYTNKSTSDMKEKIEPLIVSLNNLQDNDENIIVKNEIEQIQNEWIQIHENMAYYIEHNELETFETYLISAKSFIESSEYNEAISDLNKAIYVLDHIKEKYALSLENIF